MIVVAERQLAASQGRRLVMSEVAAEMGLSQSYAHRFFASKDDLVRALAKRWFAEVEEFCADVARRDMPAEAKLRELVVGTLRLKRAKFDENPVLFRAYLALAEDYPDLVADHAGRLSEMTGSVLQEALSPAQLQPASALVSDATALFRVPHMIAMFRHQATNERAEAVVAMLLRELRHIAAKDYR